MKTIEKKKEHERNDRDEIVQHGKQQEAIDDAPLRLPPSSSS